MAEHGGSFPDKKEGEKSKQERSKTYLSPVQVKQKLPLATFWQNLLNRKKYTAKDPT